MLVIALRNARQQGMGNKGSNRKGRGDSLEWHEYERPLLTPCPSRFDASARQCRVSIWFISLSSLTSGNMLAPIRTGIIRDNLLAFLEEDDVRAVLETNVAGVFNVTGAVVAHMLSHRAGKIINVSSVAGERGGLGQTNYAASKGAINAFTRALAVELGPRRITVNAVAPGVIQTDMTRELLEQAGDEVKSRILLRRFGLPIGVGYVIMFLASRYADYITGQIIHVDGGFKMG